MKVHFHTDDGQDHIVKSACLVTEGSEAGKILVKFTCCFDRIWTEPEEFAVSYSVSPSDSPVPTKE